jgi:hypothetical protein
MPEGRVHLHLPQTEGEEMSAKLIIGDITNIQKRGFIREEFVTSQRGPDDVERHLRHEYRVPDEAVCERMTKAEDFPWYVEFRFTWFEVSL